MAKETGKDPYVSVMSKKRLEELCEMLLPHLAQSENIPQIREEICKIMKFNPNKSKHTEARGRATMAWRDRKCSELGITVYEFNIQQKQKSLKDKKDMVSTTI